MKPTLSLFATAAILLAGCSTPLQRAAASGDTAHLVVLLKGSPAPSRDDLGLALIQASAKGEDGAAKALLDAGADAEYPDYKTGWSPLAAAAAHLHPSTVKLLLSRGARPAGVPQFLSQYGWPAGAQLLLDVAGPATPAIKAAPPAEAAQPPAPRPVGSDVDAPAYRLPENPDNFALVVGIEKYSGLPDAQYAERDAQAVRDHLLALGYPERNVRLLLGPKATNGAIAEKLNAWLSRNASENSTVFFYYSGHGSPDPATSQAYLVPWDGDPQSLEDTALPLKRLYEKLSALKAKRVIVALDSCFSGAGGRSVLPKGVRPLVNKVDVSRPQGKIVLFSASSAEEISGTVEEQGHGAFTYYFLKGLNGAADDGSGHVTAKSLHAFLLPKVRDAAARQDRDQTPQLVAGDASAIVLR